MWRHALLSSALALLAGPSAWANMADPSAFLQGAGIVGGPSLQIQDTMNFEDCSNQKIDGLCRPKYCGKGKWAMLVVALEYREPTTLVEVSCKPGQSLLMEATPGGKVVGKALNGAMKTVTAATGGKCLEQAAAQLGQQGSEGPWQFEARAFAVSPLDRYMAASGNSSKLGSATLNLVCDAAMYFGAGRGLVRSLLGGGDNFPQMNAGLPELPGGLNTVLEGMGKVGDIAGGPASLADGLTGNLTEGLEGLGGEELAKVKEGKDLLELATCAPETIALAKASAHWSYGLLPLFVSDLPHVRPCWLAGSPTDQLTSGIAATAQFASAGASEITCSASSLTDATGALMDKVGDATLGLVGNCVGSWGTKKPAVGYASNLIRPVAAGVVGWRAYDYATKTGGKNLKNTKGKVMFNLDYPFINNAGPVPGLESLFKVGGIGGRRHGQKGSGCYSPGTMNPSWYTQGESWITDPSTFAANMTADVLEKIRGSTVTSNNGDYVYTYWKNTRCCLPLRCPQKTYRDY